MGGRVRSVVVCGLLILGLLRAMLGAQPVAAHALLQRTLPANGTIATPNIGEVRLTFNEPVEVRPERVTVTGSDGRRYDLRGARRAPGDPATVVVSVPQLPNGVFTVRYALISSDTHPISGALRFGVGVTSAEVLAGAPSVQEMGLTNAVLFQGLGRWINLLGLALLIGPIAFRFFVLVPFRPRGRGGAAGEDEATVVRLYEARAVRWAWAAVVILIVGLVVGLIAAAVASSLGAAAGALRPAALAATLNGRFGTLWLARLALLLIPALALPMIAAELELGGAGDDDSEAGEVAQPPARAGRGQGGWWAILGSGAALALLTSLGGHPSTTRPVALTVAIDTAHLLATALWVGGLVAAGLILPGMTRSLGAGGAGMLAAVVPRFSALAVGCIQVLIVTGLYQSWAHIDGPATIADSAYGRALIAKLLLIAPLLGLAALNRFAIVPRLRAAVASDAPGEAAARGAATGRLWRTLWGEAALAVVVLGVVGVLTALPPGRTGATGVATGGDDAPAPASGVTLGGSAGTLLVNLTIGPTGNGPAVVAATLRDPQGTPVENATVALRATPPGGAAPLNVPLEARGGRYTGLADLGAPGAWKLEAVVTPAGGAAATATFALQLPTGGAATLLAGADAAMNRLTSLRERETIGAGGPAVTIEYAWVAPDKLQLRADTGSETIVVGKRRFDRTGNGAWLPSDWPDPQGYRWPQFAFARNAAEVTLLGRETVDGVDCWVVAFLDTTDDVRYTFWIGQADSRIYRQRMFTVGHYMESRYFDFDAPITVVAPGD